MYIYIYIYIYIKFKYDNRGNSHMVWTKQLLMLMMLTLGGPQTPACPRPCRAARGCRVPRLHCAPAAVLYIRIYIYIYTNIFIHVHIYIVYIYIYIHMYIYIQVPWGSSPHGSSPPSWGSSEPTWAPSAPPSSWLPGGVLCSMIQYGDAI